MHDSAKYLIHADIRASGVVERSDVVGAVFGQTEGLLGDELDLRELQDAQKIGRIDVEIDSESGVSRGELTIASGLDRVETAILAAALESIERIGPCRATVEVTELEDVRSAKRRQVVDRAKELLAEFDQTALTSQELVEEVRRSRRVERITEFRGLPAGPRVADSDAIIVVEGRADVLTLLEYGIKNAIAVEGTNVPDDVAELTRERTVTAFLDGDRGGDLILKELAQVGDVDYVAFAPTDRSVEDLPREAVMAALREKVPFEAVAGDGEPGGVAATDGSARPAPDANETVHRPPSEPGEPDSPDGHPSSADASVSGGHASGSDAAATPDGPDTPSPEQPEPDAESEASRADGTSRSAGEQPGSDGTADEERGEGSGASPSTLAGHVDAIVGAETGRFRFLDGDFEAIDDGAADGVFEALEGAESVPATLIVDDELTQRVLDLAAQRGVGQIVCRSEGEFVKRPTNVRIRTAGDLVGSE